MPRGKDKRSSPPKGATGAKGEDQQGDNEEEEFVTAVLEKPSTRAADYIDLEELPKGLSLKERCIWFAGRGLTMGAMARLVSRTPKTLYTWRDTDSEWATQMKLAHEVFLDNLAANFSLGALNCIHDSRWFKQAISVLAKQRPKEFAHMSTMLAEQATPTQQIRDLPMDDKLRIGKIVIEKLLSVGKIEVTDGGESPSERQLETVSRKQLPPVVGAVDPTTR